MRPDPSGGDDYDRWDVDEFYDDEYEYEPGESHWERQDDRWEIPWYQSWLILLVLIVVYLSWALLVYWFEPGIR